MSFWEYLLHIITAATLPKCNQWEKSQMWLTILSNPSPVNTVNLMSSLKCISPPRSISPSTRLVMSHKCLFYRNFFQHILSVLHLTEQPYLFLNIKHSISPFKNKYRKLTFHIFYSFAINFTFFNCMSSK